MSDYALPSSDDESAELDRMLEKLEKKKNDVSLGDFDSSSDEDDDDSLSSSDLDLSRIKENRQNRQEMLPNKTSKKNFRLETESPDRFSASSASSTGEPTANESRKSNVVNESLLTPLDDTALRDSKSASKTMKHASSQVPKRTANRDAIFSATSSEESFPALDEAELARVAQQVEEKITSPGFSTSTDSAVSPAPSMKQTRKPVPPSSSWSDDNFPFLDEAELLSVVEAAENKAAKPSLYSSTSIGPPTAEKSTALQKQEQTIASSSSLSDDSFPFMDEAELISITQAAEKTSATKTRKENNTSPFFSTTSTAPNEFTPTRSNTKRAMDIETHPRSEETKNVFALAKDQSEPITTSHPNPYRTTATSSITKSPPNANPIVTDSFPDPGSETCFPIVQSPQGLRSFDDSKTRAPAVEPSSTVVNKTSSSKKIPRDDRAPLARAPKRPRNVHYNESEASAFGFGSESTPEVDSAAQLSTKYLPQRSSVNGLDSKRQDEAAFGFDSHPLGDVAQNLPIHNIPTSHTSRPPENASQNGDYPTDNRGEVIQGPLIDSEDRVSEVHHSFYTPPPHQAKPEPMVHSFTATNRPTMMRTRTKVSQVFEPPVNSLWKSKFDTFNQLQSEMANSLAYSDDNVVVSAPTGAGKTAVFEMAMARFFAVDLQTNIRNPAGRTQQISRDRKIVYVSPSKALCEERFEDWSVRLAAMNLGIKVVLVTGDGDPGESFRDLASGHVILTTPEKWDSLTRRWTENFYLFGTVKLFLIDEIHLLADESRGCCLESIVCRMKSIQRAACQMHVTQGDIDVSRYVWPPLCSMSSSFLFAHERSLHSQLLQYDTGGIPPTHASCSSLRHPAQHLGDCCLSGGQRSSRLRPILQACPSHYSCHWPRLHWQGQQCPVSILERARPRSASYHPSVF